MLVKSDEKPFNISCDFQEWTLDDPNPGRREFFASVMDALENNESGFATFSVGVPMEEGVGGYFTNTLNLDQINLPRIAVPDIVNKTIKFVDETVSGYLIRQHARINTARIPAITVIPHRMIHDGSRPKISSASRLCSRLFLFSSSGIRQFPNSN